MLIIYLINLTFQLQILNLYLTQKVLQISFVFPANTNKTQNANFQQFTTITLKLQTIDQPMTSFSTHSRRSHMILDMIISSNPQMHLFDFFFSRGGRGRGCSCDTGFWPSFFGKYILTLIFVCASRSTNMH